jgi:hypothetical protein
MQDKEPTNLQGKPHGFYDIRWDDKYRVRCNFVNGELLGCLTWYVEIDNNINDRTYYAR